MQRNKKTFKGQNIYIGIDVHKKNWQTKGTVLLVCICQRHTKRTVPLVYLPSQEWRSVCICCHAAK